MPFQHHRLWRTKDPNSLSHVGIGPRRGDWTCFFKRKKQKARSSSFTGKGARDGLQLFGDLPTVGIAWAFAKNLQLLGETQFSTSGIVFFVSHLGLSHEIPNFSISAPEKATADAPAGACLNRRHTLLAQRHELPNFVFESHLEETFLLNTFKKAFRHGLTLSRSMDPFGLETQPRACQSISCQNHGFSDAS